MFWVLKALFCCFCFKNCLAIENNFLCLQILLMTSWVSFWRCSGGCEFRWESLLQNRPSTRLWICSPGWNFFLEFCVQSYINFIHIWNDVYVCFGCVHILHACVEKFVRLCIAFAGTGVCVCVSVCAHVHACVCTCVLYLYAYVCMCVYGVCESVFVCV